MPANPTPDLSQWKNTVLLHNGAAHNLGMVMQLALATTAPEITVDLDQIGPVPPKEGEPPVAELFTIQPKNNEVNQLPLVLYKHNGRYHALTGEAAIGRARTNQQTQVTGKLLSTPALKKARIIKVEPAPVAEVAPAPTNRYNDAAPRRPPRSGSSETNVRRDSQQERAVGGLYRTNRSGGRRYP